MISKTVPKHLRHDQHISNSQIHQHAKPAHLKNGQKTGMVELVAEAMVLRRHSENALHLRRYLPPAHLKMDPDTAVALAGNGSVVSPITGERPKHLRKDRATGAVTYVAASGSGDARITGIEETRNKRLHSAQKPKRMHRKIAAAVAVLGIALGAVTDPGAARAGANQTSNTISAKARDYIARRFWQAEAMYNDQFDSVSPKVRMTFDKWAKNYAQEARSTAASYGLVGLVHGANVILANTINQYKLNVASAKEGLTYPYIAASSGQGTSAAKSTHLRAPVGERLEMQEVRAITFGNTAISMSLQYSQYLLGSYNKQITAFAQLSVRYANQAVQLANEIPGMAGLKKVQQAGALLGVEEKKASELFAQVKRSEAQITAQSQ